MYKSFSKHVQIVLAIIYIGAGNWFTLFCMVGAMMRLPVVMELSADRWLMCLVGLITCFGYALVGCAPRFKTYQYQAHIAGVVLCAGGSVLWSCMAGMWYLPIPFAVAALAIGLLFGNRVLWIELAAFASFDLALYLLAR